MVNGYEFTREEDGSVLIRATTTAASFSPREWAEIVASVTRRGADAVDDALTLHTMHERFRELTPDQLAAALPRRT